MDLEFRLIPIKAKLDPKVVHDFWRAAWEPLGHALLRTLRP